jgi:hypothetical protein
MFVTEIELDVTTGELRWRRDKTEFYYWVRSDRCQQATPKDCKELAEENARLKRENEELRRELAQIKERLASILK